MPRTIIDLNELAENGHPGLTAVEAASLVEAAIVCADHVARPLPQIGEISGSRRLRPQFLGPNVDERMRRTHRDIQDATERGATALAVSIIKQTHDLVVVERSPKNGYGFDYYLGALDNDEDIDNFFAAPTHTLEVSGTVQDDEDELGDRTREKVRRLRRRPQPYPAFVIVFDFFRTRARITRPRLRIENANP